MKRIGTGRVTEIVLREVFFLFIYLAFLFAPIAGRFPELTGAYWLLVALVPYAAFQAFRYYYAIRRKEPFAAYIEFVFLKALWLVGTIMVFIGIALFIGQAWRYLKYGFWPEMPMLSWMSSNVAEWVTSPGSWIGLSKIVGSILRSVSAPFALCVLGFPFALLKPNLEDLKQLYAEKGNDA